MSSLLPFDESLRVGWPADWNEVGVLLAVSGGADSIALLRAAERMAGGSTAPLAVGHFNHQVRGAESDADQAHVAQVCKTLGTPLHIGNPQADIPAAMPDAREAAAREARYDFLRRTAERIGARYVATAHTADDQAETILHRILRGTGLAGLSGMRRARLLGPNVTLVRPMLHVSRREVCAYLASLNQSYRDDASNLDPSFLRNRIRHELLPLLRRDYAPGVAESLVRLGSLAADAQRVIACRVEELLEACLIDVAAEGATLDCVALARADRHLAREVMAMLWRRQGWPMAAMGFAEWDLLAGMALAKCVPAATAMKRVFPGAITAERLGDQIVLRSQRPPSVG